MGQEVTVVRGTNTCSHYSLYSLILPTRSKHSFPYIDLPSILAIRLRSLILRISIKGNSPLPTLTGGVSTKQSIEKRIYLYSIGISKYIRGIEIIIPRFETQATRQVMDVPRYSNRNTGDGVGVTNLIQFIVGSIMHQLDIA